MKGYEYVLGIVLLVVSVFLIAAVLLQQGKSKNLGTITGGAETFFGKEKGRTVDRLLAKVTTVVSVLFVLVVIAVYVFQSGT